MAINSSTPNVPEAHVTVPDESISSSNGGINIALVLTVLLSLACIVWAAIAVPRWNFDGDKTRPENIRQNANLRDPNTMAPGTTAGPVLPYKGNYHDSGSKSYVNGQAVTGDTITSGPGAPPSGTSGQDERGGVTSNSGANK
ncbi:MAG: hypothetical protein HYX67_09780 [Candidatus Melainabacteria bacterium]|nr:hypothetical protein [Candidatus Melainabacteria bacterium]